jgi:hypothetical protein
VPDNDEPAEQICYGDLDSASQNRHQCAVGSGYEFVRGIFLSTYFEIAKIQLTCFS